jgi:hypothetical protein
MHRNWCTWPRAGGKPLTKIATAPTPEPLLVYPLKQTSTVGLALTIIAICRSNDLIAFVAQGGLSPMLSETAR